MKLRYKSSTGFTLIEITILLSLFTVVVFALVVILLGNNNLFGFLRTAVLSGQGGRLAADRVLMQTREADAVVANRVFSGQSYNSGENTLILEMKTVDSANEFISGSFDYAVYHLNPTKPNQLIEEVEAAPGSRRASQTRILTDQVLSLSFAYDQPNPQNAHEVTLRLVTSAQYKSSSSTIPLMVSAKLRDKN